MKIFLRPLPFTDFWQKLWESQICRSESTLNCRSRYLCIKLTHTTYIMWWETNWQSSLKGCNDQFCRFVRFNALWTFYFMYKQSVIDQRIVLCVEENLLSRSSLTLKFPWNWNVLIILQWQHNFKIKRVQQLKSYSTNTYALTHVLLYKQKTQ